MNSSVVYQGTLVDGFSSKFYKYKWILEHEELQ